ncbi:IS110 family RNA-guided transposase [Marinoscillum furvescens]|uniref:Transposase n=1 Tax=Marinoscillum furvescens DSM 4134 TaxID=1122208 RepID=A0A3D9L6I6_MARFU|nr:IS110 family transposase [Marinoscillum furvescens]REE01306.1 transposase [Marinoscillum furvescens DSM 4134]
MEKYCVGIDVDKHTFKACLMVQSDRKKVLSSRSFKNVFSGFTGLLLWVEKWCKDHQVNFVMEATGVYHEYLAYFLHDKNQVTHVVLPLRSKRYMQSLGIRSKTDPIDAKGLSMMGLEQDLEQWIPASKHLLELRSLTRQIETLQAHGTAFKNQREGAKHTKVLHRSVLKSLEKMITEVQTQIDKLEKQVEKLIFNDPVLKQKYDQLTSIKGVGLMSFAVVVAETNGFLLFKNHRQLVCYAGYDVVENQSGRRVGKTKISKKGNAHIRRILNMSSWAVVRYKIEPFHSLFNRVYERTKMKMKGYVSVQRKLLVMMYTLWVKGEKFDPKYGSSGNQELMPLFSVGSTGTRKATASINVEAALDGLPCNQSPKPSFR